MILLRKGKMDYYVSRETLDCFEEVVYEINMKLIKEIHKKFLKDVDFEELKKVLDGIKNKTYTIEVNEDSDEEN